jgi:transposase
MNLFVLFSDGAITRKKKDGNFSSYATRNDAVSRHFFPVILHHQTKILIRSLNNANKFYGFSSIKSFVLIQWMKVCEYRNYEINAKVTFPPSILVGAFIALSFGLHVFATIGYLYMTLFKKYNYAQINLVLYLKWWYGENMKHAKLNLVLMHNTFMDKFKKWTWGLWYFIDICHNFHSSHRG